MGVITISLDAKSEKLLRDSAKMLYGDRKDALSKTIVRAITQSADAREMTKKQLVNLMVNNPIRMKKGAKLPKTRAEYYEKD